MCSYNKVNGKYASENPELLNGVLRDEWGFEGLVMSDWGAVNDRVEGLKCGLDLEMPGDIGHNRQAIIDAVNDGSLSIEVVDRAVSRVLNMINNTLPDGSESPAKFEEHAELAKEISLDSAVLMKNDGALPLAESESYLVIGEMFDKMRYQGAGSSLIRPYKLTTPKMAFDNHGVRYEYEQGYIVDRFDDDKALLDRALEKAKNADTIIFFGGLSEYAESEGFDRNTLSLPENQLNLLARLGELSKKIIFVMFGGSPVDTSFDSGVNALLNMYLPGEEGGESVYELLFGKASPSGKLAESWPLSYGDVAFGDEFTLTTNDRYKESVFVGYRYYSSFGIGVKYPFGYGLSYTSFEYSNMRVDRQGDSYKVTLDVTNTGKMRGATVAEIFVEAPKSEVVKPLRELRGFGKICLDAGETKEICIDIPVERLKYYIDGAWRLENGEYIFSLCADANTVIFSVKVSVTDGERISENSIYRELYGKERLAITDEQFDRLIGREIPKPEVKRPYDLNTPLKEYKTLGGKALYGGVMLGFKIVYNKEKRSKDSPDKETRIKNAYFAWQTISVMSLRSISFASEGMLSYKMANVLLDVANNRIFRAVARLFKKEKCSNLPE